ncbi:MAG: molecular chaperone DnaJ, partial [Chloroflexota bacterium]
RILEKDGRRLEVKIPPGVHTGSRVRIKGEGAPGIRGAPGDLYLRINVLPHERFRVEGADLHTEVPVDLYTAVLGGEVVVPTLNGNVMLRIPPETQGGQVFRLRGKGMPKLGQPTERGDLLVKVQIQIPRNLTPRERELFQELARLRKR